MESENNINILDKIYDIRLEYLEERANQDRKKLSERLNNVTIEEIENVIKKDIEKQEKKQELLEKLDKLVENYEIKMAYYREKAYKQGFKDGVNLIKQCECGKN